MKVFGWDGIFADWRSLMAAILHWLDGENPYDFYTGFSGEFYDAGYFAYPPPALFIATPLALMPWWLSAVLVQAIAIVAFERWARGTTGRSALMWILLWPPLMQGLYIGQTTLLFLMALLLAERAANQQNDRMAGLILAFALLKPQVGIFAIAYLLIVSLWMRRWRLIGVFTLATAVLWGGALLLAGPQIYIQWLNGLNAYRYALPDQPTISFPLGPLVVLLAMLLWRRNLRDIFGLALLLNTLLYPLSVLYIISPIAAVVIRWRHDWQLWAVALGWIVPIMFTFVASTYNPVLWYAQIQLFAAFALLVGLLPIMHLWRRPASVTVAPE